MSEKTIYQTLRDGGLSPCGACAMMGNMWAESGLRSNNVQDNCPMSDSDYTYNVDNRIISKWQFETDRYGYGLCQWTLDSRKDALYLFAKAKGVSISDEQIQCEFCLKELREDFDSLYKYLCTTEDLPKATERICAEFERPAVNNFSARINAAQRYYNQFADQTVEKPCGGGSCPIEIPADETCSVDIRVLKRGMKGRDVFLAQCGMLDIGLDLGKYGADGDFGECTEKAVMDLQENCEIEPTGIINCDTWKIIIK